ncbi:MAG: WD40 repeat domain-containing serine/threonine protein kinase [Kofleriaceae bacterium]
MSEGDRTDEADAHAGTIPGVGPTIAIPAAPATNAADAATLAPALAATVAPENAPTMAATQASMIDRRVIAQAATLPASGADGASTIDVPHAATLQGPHVEADLPAMQKVPDNAYAIGDEIARGGMGKILSARDRRLRRDIVIKVVRAGHVDPRFEREALITARLQHPSIVRVYEAGLLGDGRAFYAMERVRGRSLEKIVDESANVQARLALLPHAIAVADAIAYAHSEGVLHRDLKPSNVLIGPFGETVVIDWGLAKDLRAGEGAESLDPSSPSASSSGSGAVSARGSDSSSAVLTQIGSVLGTPSFMAPEQARGDASDERTDIYALGALLYTLLSGVPPHRGRTTEEVLESVSAGRRVPLVEREPTLPPELVTIVERAMALRAADRYQGAKELADDLRAFAAGKLVASHQYSLWRLVRRFVARHKLSVAVVAFAVVVLAITGVLSIESIVRARDDASEQRKRAELAREQAQKNLSDLNRSTDEFFRNQARALADRDPSHAAGFLEKLSDRALHESRTHELAIAISRTGFGWELRGHTGDIEILAMSPDRSLVATASDDATLRVWSIAERTSRYTLVGHVGPIEDVEFSPDGNHVASAGTDGNVYLWDVRTGTGRKLAGHKSTVRNVAFSPDGKQLASTGEDGRIYLWDVTTGTSKLVNERALGWRPLLWSLDGTTIIAGGFDGSIGYFVPAQNKSRITPGARMEIRCFALSHDGTLLASGDENGRVMIWRGDVGTEVGRHVDVVRDLAFSPDDKLLVSAGGDDIVGVYALGTNVRTELRGNTSGVKDLDVSPDGTLVASAGIDGIARVWPIAGGAPRELRGHDTAIKGVVFASRTMLVSASEDDNARLWRLDDVETPPKGPALRAWLDARTNVEVDVAPGATSSSSTRP